MKKLLALIILALFAVPALVTAATFEKGDAVSVSAPLSDNFYGAGKNVSIGSEVTGDVLIAGDNLTISESVSDDVFAAGGSISILKEVMGDVRAAGGTILINSAVGKDLLVAGGVINLSPTSSVGRDLVAAGETITVGGNVSGSIKIYGSDVSINSIIKGDALIKASKSLTFGPTAQIKGSLKYSAPKEISIDTNVVTGETTYEKSGRPHRGDKDKEWFFSAVLAFFSFKFLVILLGSLFLLRLVPGLILETVTQALSSSGREFVRGLVLAIVMPILAVLFLVTIIGALVGGFVGSAFLLLILLAKGMAGIVLGALLLRLMKRNDFLIINWKSVVLGVFVLQLLCFIPIIGWAAHAAIVLMTLGALSISLYRKMQTL